ncbi:MAG: hypothetical protein BJ554DRAFT_2616 [Olpidium bornovanus]|uniref:Uncharacterized protein n=1 Tax=Olpidium bornovanus TaxID=278681 RepID=A0A8H8DGI2_9FUNG|nr:MAG: hypothetical protein BJ554DRAFT_2616 [Olpidium bornovanus]
MLGEKVSSYGGPNLDSNSSLSSTLSSASTIAKLSGVVASKARGETHPTEPHKSPKRVRYDAHGRGAFIPVSDDEVEVASSADEIHGDDSGGDLAREPERFANGMLATVANIATASKETIVKALDILVPTGLPKIELDTDVSNSSEYGTIPEKAFTTEQAVPAHSVNEPSADDTEAASGCQDHNAGGVGHIVENSIRSAAGKVASEVPSVAASDNSTQDIRVRGEAAVHPLAGTEPEPESSSSLRKRASAAAQRASTEAAKDSSSAKDGAARFEWCAGYTLAAAGSVLLVYVIVPLVVRAVTKA